MSAPLPDPQAFWQLREAPLHAFGPEDFARYYPQMAGWLAHDDPAIRAAAVERLCMAVFRSEPMKPDRPRDDAKALDRLAWLLNEIEVAALVHPDILAAVLAQLRWHGDDAPFSGPVTAWLDRLADDRRFAVPLERITAAKVLVGGFGTGEAARPALLALLDDPSDCVRACAANRLAETFDIGPDLAFVETLKAKEIARPGIFGPFWGAWDPAPDALPVDAATYLLDIIARRSGPEPADMPFNGVDFHLHEVAGDSADIVGRLIALGHHGTALLTATEMDHVVNGMAAHLETLGALDEPAIARPAQMHLAQVYRTLHPRADPQRLRHLPNWQPGAEAFVMRQGTEAHWRDVVVLHPAEPGATFDDATAWRLIDLALPPEVRGVEVRHKLSVAEAPTLALVFGPHEDHAFASGARVNLTGDPEARRWQRVTLIGSGLQKRWAPLDWA